MRRAFFRCRCCKRRWRGLVKPPKAGSYFALWGTDVEGICGRCNGGECSRAEDDLRADIGCNEGIK